MADNLEKRVINGVEKVSFVENGSQERAWHSLGQVYDHPLSVTEALQGCNADFLVSKQPIVTLTPKLVELMESGEMINARQLKQFIINGKVATMRNDIDATLGIVGSTYGVVQNHDAFKFIDALCTGGQGTPCIESAGLLGGGERIFVTAKFPEPVRLAHKDNDLVEMYIVFTTTHDGTGGVTAMVTPIRVVCNNTLNAAFRDNSGRWNVRHTSNVQNRIEDIAEASRALQLYDVYKTEFEDNMFALSQKHYNDKEIESIVAHTILPTTEHKVYDLLGLDGEGISTRAKNQVYDVLDTLHSGIGQNMVESGTGLWIYNGVTCYYQNVAPQKDAEKHFSSLTSDTGLARKKTQSAYNLLSV